MDRAEWIEKAAAIQSLIREPNSETDKALVAAEGKFKSPLTPYGTEVVFSELFLKKAEAAGIFNIEKKVVESGKILIVEDGSVDLDDLDKMEITYIVYRQGAKVPAWIEDRR